MSVKNVLLKHRCPVCKYNSEELYEKSTHELSVFGGLSISYSFIELKSGSDRFVQIKHDNKNYVGCPKCGTVLMANVCETEEEL
ncbi:MAG: hypothetical protein IJ220_05930 [Clostridia bacterium]|nr:hypothetical protein [Clostridia bacterium]